MNDQAALKYGEQPGLRFAVVLDGHGGCREMDWPGVDAWKPADGVLWIHLERDDPQAQAWLRYRSGIDPLTVEALLAEETRPRVEDFDESMLVVLRGVNRSRAGELLELVPIHLWIEHSRIISLRDKNHYMLALRDIREALFNGKGPRRTGALFTRIAEKLVKYLEPVINEFEDRADHLDETLLQHPTDQCRAELSDLRRHAILLRRYLAPQREALFRLQVEDAPWLSKRDKIRLRETTDKVLRHLENLDAIRDRSTILHEDLASQIAEEQARASNRLTTVAAVLLPPTLFTGLLGSNVEGIPYKDHPWAFAIACLIVLAMFALEIWLLRKMKWL
ncbi:MAG: zinc transporter ZntB [Alphaproteobacteria bacterium]|nr:zinc transporter ZntB [Alphaproteobacteria bacterium]